MSFTVGSGHLELLKVEVGSRGCLQIEHSRSEGWRVRGSMPVMLRIICCWRAALLVLAIAAEKFEVEF